MRLCMCSSMVVPFVRHIVWNRVSEAYSEQVLDMVALGVMMEGTVGQETNIYDELEQEESVDERTVGRGRE